MPNHSAGVKRKSFGASKVTYLEFKITETIPRQAFSGRILCSFDPVATLSDESARAKHKLSEEDLAKLTRERESDYCVRPRDKFTIVLTGAVKRLGFPNFTQRSLRRMFITRALGKGIDVQTIARWQGHRDGGKLILDTYGHVTSAHTDRMAAMMTEETPANVVPIMQADAS